MLQRDDVYADQNLGRCALFVVATAKVLSTLCYEYLETRPVFQTQHSEEDFAELNVEDILVTLVGEHQQLIELYRFLYWRAETVLAQDLLKQLLTLEEHQVLKIIQSSSHS